MKAKAPETTRASAAPLRSQIIQHRAEGPPGRRLIFSCRIENRSATALALLSSWVDVHANPGAVTVRSGCLLKPAYARHLAVIPAGGELIAEYYVPFGEAVIAEIDRQRVDRISLTFANSCVFAPLIKQPAASSRKPSLALGVPREIWLNQYGGTLEYSIARSDWLNLLRLWRWREIELFELAFDYGRESPKFRRAFDHLRGAEEKYRDGDYPNTFQQCRLAIEGLANEAADTGDMRSRFAVLLGARIQGKEKRKAVDDLLNALSKLTHVGRHDEGVQEVITRGEALMTLRMTLAFVQALAGS